MIEVSEDKTITINNKTIERVREFNYLEEMIEECGDAAAAVELKINVAGVNPGILVVYSTAKACL